MKKWAAEFKRGRDDERTGRPKDATTNVEIVHNLVMCDRRRDLRSGHKFWGSANNSNGYLVYVQGLGKMGTENEKRYRLDISKYLLSLSTEF